MRTTAWWLREKVLWRRNVGEVDLHKLCKKVCQYGEWRGWSAGR